MLAGEARAVARRWVAERGPGIPGYLGAFFHGSIAWLADDEPIAPTSDLDIMIVLDESDPPVKPGKFVHHGVLLEVSHLPVTRVGSPEEVLGQSDLAGSFRAPSVIDDPTGRLTILQAAVARDYHRRRWVERRCHHARGKCLANLRALRSATTFVDQALSWLFAAGVTTHILLVAGLANPTVRRRYVAARDLLADYGHSDFYESLLALLGCTAMAPQRARQHLDALTAVFDHAKGLVATPFPFASDLTEQARPIAIDGSREMIERGDHREAVFWLVATYSRCLKVLAADAPAAVYDQFAGGFRELLRDLGIASATDLLHRGEEVELFLPQVSRVAERIMDDNQAIGA